MVVVAAAAARAGRPAELIEANLVETRWDRLRSVPMTHLLCPYPSAATAASRRPWGLGRHEPSRGALAMNVGLRFRAGCALLLVLLFGACRARTPARPVIDWQRGAGGQAETAALLSVDQGGTARLLCLPGRTGERPLWGGVALARILDAGWNQGPVVAAWASAAGAAQTSSDRELVLLAPRGEPRRLAKGVQSARFSPDASALAYEIIASPGDAPNAAPITTYVMELSTAKVTEVGPLESPRWEADGKHLRATRRLAAGADREGFDGRSRPLRARWSRESGSITTVGPGTSQIPAPAGSAVAWAAHIRTGVPASPCIVYLTPRGGVPHTVVGRFCMDVADERAVRWSADGRWLAFAHPGIVPGRSERGGFFVDVVGVEGGRYPALSALHARSRPEELAIAVAPQEVWFDWSPSGRFLALQDGALHVRVYDFEAHGTADLGKGQKPMWSPGGAYLLVLAAARAAGADRDPSSQHAWAGEATAAQAFVLRGSAPGARMSLGFARDIRWLPAQACDASTP